MRYKGRIKKIGRRNILNIVPPKKDTCSSTKKNETGVAIDNMLDLISFSSEISFSSGYRSSNFDETIESEIDTVIDNIDLQKKSERDLESSNEEN